MTFMRRHILLSVFALVCVSLQARPSPEWFRRGIVYQIQPRAFTPEGTLGAWARMQRTFPALTHGTTQWLDNDCPAAVLSFLRTLRGMESSGLPHGEDVFFAGNFSGRAVKVRLQDGRRLKLGPWEYVFEPIKPNQYAR